MDDRDNPSPPRCAETRQQGGAIGRLLHENGHGTASDDNRARIEKLAYELYQQRRTAERIR